jgi:SnoaL-like domain
VPETYDATTHFNGQSTITLDGDHATAETDCLATTYGLRMASARS